MRSSWLGILSVVAVSALIGGLAGVLTSAAGLPPWASGGVAGGIAGALAASILASGTTQAEKTP